MAGAAAGGEIPAEVAAQGRRRAEALAPGPVVRALREGEQAGADRRVLDRLWAWAGLGATMWTALHEAQARAGRQVVNIIFTYHQRLGVHPEGECLAPEAAAGLRPFEGWLGRVVSESPAERAALINWVDVFSERLTLHRYNNVAHRRRHALALLGTPLRLSLGLAADESAAGRIAEFGELALRFWDLILAEEQTEVGWNRLMPEDTPPMGGFYGLADQARIPETETIRTAAELLRQDLERARAEIDPRIDGWLEVLRKTMIEAVREWLESGNWPETRPAGGPKGWLARIKGLLMKPGR